MTQETNSQSPANAVVAFPLSCEKLAPLLSYLDEELRVLAAGGYDKLILLRDAALLAYLWDSFQRGGEGARLAYEDLTWQGDDTVISSPNRVKNIQHRRCGELEIGLNADPHICFIRRQRSLKAEMQAAGYLVTGAAPVFPTSVGRRFTQHGMSYGAVRETRKRMPYKQVTEGLRLYG
jgi:integrase